MAFLRSALWDGRKHYLDRMTVPDLVRAYFAFPAIQGYLGLGVLSTVTAIYIWPGFLVALAAVAISRPSVAGHAPTAHRGDVPRLIRRFTPPPSREIQKEKLTAWRRRLLRPCLRQRQSKSKP